MSAPIRHDLAKFEGWESPWSLGDARQEAKGLVRIVAQGKMTRTEIRELIRVPREVVKLWRTIPNPLFRARLREILDFRLRVLRKFDEILRQQEPKKQYEQAALEALEVPNG